MLGANLLPSLKLVISGKVELIINLESNISWSSTSESIARPSVSKFSFFNKKEDTRSEFYSEEYN